MILSFIITFNTIILPLNCSLDDFERVEDSVAQHLEEKENTYVEHSSNTVLSQTRTGVE